MWAWSCQNGLGFPFDKTFIFGFEVAVILVLCVQIWVMFGDEKDDLDPSE